MYLPGLDWDGIYMGKTIALKLSKKEEQFLTQINNKGMTNSELLRSALRQYFQNMQEFSSDGVIMKSVFVKQENVSEDVFDLVQQLKSDMQVLQGQLEKIQKQVDSDVRTLQRQLLLLASSAPSVQQVFSSVKRDIVHDIHQQVDEFLCKQTQKNGVQ
jgi:GTP-binding protein EngB required for normal cell division